MKKKNPLAKYTDSELEKELERRHKKRQGPIKGYRAISYGNDYNYGGYIDYMIDDKNGWDKQCCLQYANQAISSSDNGGYVEEIYKDTPKPGKIY